MKNLLKKWWFWVIAIFVIGFILKIAGYNGNTGTSISNKEDITKFYKIISERNKEVMSVNKCWIKTELVGVIDSLKLLEIANELKSSRGRFDQIWIYHYIKGMDTSDIPFATTHFMPNLEIKINKY